MSDIDDVVREFLVESHEGLDQLDRDLVALEQAPDDRGRLAAIFRCIHTIKGTCGFLGFGKLEKVAHVGETLLQLLRDGALTLSPEIASALLRMVDAVRAMLASIEASGAEGDGDYRALEGELARLAKREEAPDIAVDEADVLFAAARQAKLAAAAAAAAPPAVTAAAPATPAPVVPALAASAPAAATAPDAVAGNSALADHTIRVDVAQLDKLMTLVGELVLARNQLLQITGQMENGAVQAATQRLNLITTELQEGVMKTRMQPIGNVWSKFPRVVRDLATALGKQVTLEMDGEGTELDRTIIEAIKDPLTHIVRNSVDHGIEAPAARVAAGKPAMGRIRLRAYHEGGQVNIEIAEDGRGIDVEKVKAKALERGLVSAEQLARMSDREVQQLIFLAGFSTADQVTNLSGRGVGMDVVRTNIERIGGTIDLVSTLNHGTTLKIKIPLTLAIIPALTVSAEGARYCIPQVNLVELVRLSGGAGGGIEHVLGAPVYRLRGQLLPLCFLNRELGLGETAAAAESELVVLQADGRPFGLIVDAIHDTEEIVVKPLGTHLAAVPVYAGATILGDGAVALILDVLGLAQRAHVLADATEAAGTRSAAVAAKAAKGPVSRLIVCSAGDRRIAFSLGHVARLEEVAVAAIERIADREVLQYRGELLPLVRMSDLLGSASTHAGERLPTIVYAYEGLQVGLVVDRILDVVEDAARVTSPVIADGIAGAAVIGEVVTDLIDVESLLRSRCHWLATADVASGTPEPALV